ncbi:MAG: hypothetical protein GY710_06290 [Desulfobacteraceae bacterium]|nr:hypothetical protein [Desulfobacteraceae bacterium]
MNILAIDPGSTESGWVIWDGKEIKSKGKNNNSWLLEVLRIGIFPTPLMVIEGINPYTMGKTTRDTILWSGRFQEAYENKSRKLAEYLFRNDVRFGLCGSKSTKINDKVIRQALVDRFTYGQKNFGKGTKKSPGFFYGFEDDIWQAFSVAVVYYDQLQEGNK